MLFYFKVFIKKKTRFECWICSLSCPVIQGCIKENNVKHNLQIHRQHTVYFAPGFFQNNFCFRVNVNDFVIMPNIQLLV